MDDIKQNHSIYTHSAEALIILLCNLLYSRSHSNSIPYNWNSIHNIFRQFCHSISTSHIFQCHFTDSYNLAQTIVLTSNAINAIPVILNILQYCKPLLTSLVPWPLPDFISQPWRKIGRKPGNIATSRTGNGGLGYSTNRVHMAY